MEKLLFVSRIKVFPFFFCVIFSVFISSALGGGSNTSVWFVTKKGGQKKKYGEPSFPRQVSGR